ncbi:MAG: zinc ABC transporter substrate-binding protein [Caldilineaceae bacterium]
MRLKSMLLMMLMLLLLVTACGGAGATAATADGPLQIVTTTSMITDITSVVGGDQVAVTGLMGAGIDPHLYVASEGDMELLQNAEVIFYNGLLLEAQMAEILEQLGERKTVVAVAGTIDEQQLLPWAQYVDEFDPHVWFDVSLWMKAVETVRDTLVEVDAANADAYQANAANYLEELGQLDAYVKEQAERLPAEQRILVTAHDAFHYFGRAYGFDVRGLQGISTASEAGTADVQALADFIAEKQLKAIFVESSVPVRNIEALQAAVEARGFTVAIGGQLFSDAMGDPGTPEGTYVGMVRHNIDTIVGALLGE